MMGPWDRPGLGRVMPFIGTYALSGILVALCGILAALVVRKRFLPVAAICVLLAALVYWPAGEGRQGTLPLTLVQPNFQQAEMDNPALYEETVSAGRPAQPSATTA